MQITRTVFSRKACPKPPDGIRVRTADDFFPLYGNHFALTVYGPLLMYIIFGAKPLVAGYIIALESLGLDNRGDQHLRRQSAR